MDNVTARNFIHGIGKRDCGIGIFLWICEMFKSNFFYRTPPVAASVDYVN